MRLTNNWTTGEDALEDAFGLSGRKGSAGEKLFAKQLDSRQFVYHHHTDDKRLQISGWDFQVGEQGIDVKANFKNGKFGIELGEMGWLRNPKKTSHIICHVDLSTEQHVWYFRDEAIEFLPVSHSEFTMFSPKQLPFVKYNIFNFI